MNDVLFFVFFRSFSVLCASRRVSFKRHVDFTGHEAAEQWLVYIWFITSHLLCCVFFFFPPKISSRLSASLAEKSPTVKPPAPTTTSKNTRGLYCLCFLLHVCGNGFWDSALASSEEPLTEDWKYQWLKVGRRCHAGFALNEYLIKNAAFQLSLKGYWALKLPGTMQEVVRGAKWSTPIPDRNTQKRILCFF